jgi:pyruvate dehydrogenase E1 component
MFGFQRVGDLIWAAGDVQARGFLIGCTSGRTSLPGEGLQHQDGNSHVLALPFPHIRAYDPTFAYELAIIVQDGMRRMYEDGEHCVYYITVTNENYEQPAMPEGVRDGIIKGLYKYKAASGEDAKHRVQLLGSGAILNEAVGAQGILETYGVAADVWSATSYKALHRDAMETERWNRLHQGEDRRTPYVLDCLGGTEGPVVAATDYVKALPETIGRWLGDRYTTLGTDGFGRSDTRAGLRGFFEVDARHIALAALDRLAARGELERDVVAKAIDDFGLEPDKPDPATA